MAHSRLTQNPRTTVHAIGGTSAAISAPSSIQNRNGSNTCHPHQAEQPARDPGSHRRDFSAGAVLREQNIHFVQCARGSVDAQIPLRDYFLWVGGALLVLLFAADSLLPAPPPSKLIESHFTRPPIRITSDLKGPEAVVIETSQPDFLPVLPGKEFAVAPSPPLRSDVADVVRQPPTSLSEQADASDVNPAISPVSVKRWRS